MYRSVTDAGEAGRRKKSLSEQLFPVHQRIASFSILGLWGTYFFIVTLRGIYIEIPNPEAVFVQRILMTSICILFTWLLYRMLIAVRESGIAMSIFIVAVPTVLFAMIIAICDQIIFNLDAALFDFSHLVQPIDFRTLDWPYILDEAFTRYFIIAGWGTLYLAMAHSKDVQDMVAHSRKLEQVNRENELRALRYQLNPHFVFNALNSVSSLIIDRKNEQAEKLVDDLADYMRVVLRDGDHNLVTIAQEVDQQLRYLEIEKMRFPRRLSYEVEIDEAVKDWRIPALIIQPLVENAIKYGVASSQGPVRIVISATTIDDNLHISVANDGRVQPAPDGISGTGTGLSNIRERLAALYGPLASLSLANSNDGMAIAQIILPKQSQIFGGN